MDSQQEFIELANNIIDRVSEVIMEHYGIEPKHITDDDSIENPALINGTIYYDLEQEIMDMIKAFMVIDADGEKPSFRSNFKGMNAINIGGRDFYLSDEDCDKLVKEMRELTG